jgi:hypothetical protein
MYTQNKFSFRINIYRDLCITPKKVSLRTLGIYLYTMDICEMKCQPFDVSFTAARFKIKVSKLMKLIFNFSNFILVQ